MAKKIETQPKEKNMRQLTGVVVSDKMDKTRTIAVTETRRHPIYQKTYQVTAKIKAHDEKNEYKMGDKVEIVETRRISKDKAWKIARLVSKGTVVEEIIDEPSLDGKTND